jgi:Zn-dependent protease
MNSRQNSIHLFRFAGIDVFLHWSWFFVAVYEIGSRQTTYSSVAWNVLEYLALFLMVMLHEFGHALACRSVGGTANQIMLWPLGGVAYVNPPRRPGATLWSIAAGPLVNVALIPVLMIFVGLDRSLGWAQSMPNAHLILRSIFYVNAGLLIFNLLPIYPLDGGQILRALLWFVIGRARSLIVTTMIGFVGAAGFVLLAVKTQSIWFGALSAFVIMYCWRGFKLARALYQLANAPHNDSFHCPSCKAAPPMGNFWTCPQCKQRFDTFQTHAVCPHCAKQFPQTMCANCGEKHPLDAWLSGTLAPSRLPEPVEALISRS